MRRFRILYWLQEVSLLGDQEHQKTVQRSYSSSLSAKIIFSQRFLINSIRGSEKQGIHKGPTIVRNELNLNNY